MTNVEMAFPDAFIPYGTWGGSYFPAWHSSPLAEVDIARFAAEGMALILGKREVPIGELGYLISGSTIPWMNEFWGVTYLTQCLGHRLPGFLLSQACATGLQAIIQAMGKVNAKDRQVVAALLFDRTSNSPAVTYPVQGTYRRTEVVSNIWDHFGNDPSAEEAGFSKDNGETSMIACAGRAARKYRLDYREAAELAFYRYHQYWEAKNAGILDEFLFPMEILDVRGKKTGEVNKDSGVRVYESIDEILGQRQLDTCVTAGTQTHPSDGMFTILAATEEKARELSPRPEISIQLVGSTEVRTLAGFMPEAPTIAVKQLLEKTGLTMGDMKVVYTHNPFAVNDLILAKELDHDWHKMNITGCPMVYGHPQGPTLARVTVEALETTVMFGGGYTLVCGCAAGDVGIAAIFLVTERSN